MAEVEHYQQQQPNVIITKSTKSVGLAVVLGLLFGPLGLFYASITGGIIMFILTVIIAFITMGIGLLIVCPICAIWGGIAASMYNKKLAQGLS